MDNSLILIKILGQEVDAMKINNPTLKAIFMSESVNSKSQASELEFGTEWDDTSDWGDWSDYYSDRS